MVWRFYDLLSTLATPLSLPFFALHPRLKGGVRQRLGSLPAAPAGGVWFHGASAGDVNALLPIAAGWAAVGGRGRASALTRSGVDFLARKAPPELSPFYAPLDISWVLRRVMARLVPSALVFEHLELWPGLWRAASRSGVPLALVNARLSVSSARRYRRFPSLFAAPFASLSMVAAASPEDRQRFIELGVRPERIWIAEQSTKYAALDTTLPLSSRAPCVVFGSVHPREERLLLPLLPALVGAGTHVILAPRHPHRAAALLRRLGREGSRAFSSSRASEKRGELGVEVLDRIGQLPAAYERATVAFVGGSLERRGGHNVLEAARAGCPVVTGPHIDSCAREMAALRRVDAGAIEPNAEALLLRLRCWSHYDGARAAAAQRAAAAIAEEAKAVVERIVGWLRASV